MKHIYIIGTGLIGGSLALDFKNALPDCIIYGIDKNEAHLIEAQELGVIDQKATYEDLPNADLVVLAIPVDVAVNELPKVLNKVSDFSVVIDVGSTKQAICKAVDNHPKRRNFLATHPIAGTEFSGPKAAINMASRYITLAAPLLLTETIWSNHSNNENLSLQNLMEQY